MQIASPVPQLPLAGGPPSTPKYVRKPLISVSNSFGSNSNYINMPRFHIPSTKSSFTPMLISHPSNLAEDHLLNSNIASLSPSAEDIRPLTALVQAVTSKLEEFKGYVALYSRSAKLTISIFRPLLEGADELLDGREKTVIMDLKMVGPYARGTLIKSQLCADIVLITKGIVYSSYLLLVLTESQNHRILLCYSNSKTC